jgi:hypothetical protein
MPCVQLCLWRVASSPTEARLSSTIQSVTAQGLESVRHLVAAHPSRDVEFGSAISDF